MNTPRSIVACRVMEPELSAIAEQLARPPAITYLEQSLHRTPHQMPGRIMDALKTVPADHAAVLCYGLCANGIVGVTAPPGGLIVPKAHDCITFFLGSRAAYETIFTQTPGVYYLTPGWVAEGKDPIGIMRGEYTERVGESAAEWVMREELKHYRRITFIDTGAGDAPALREKARENARFFDMEYTELKGDPRFFRMMMEGPYDSGDFLFFPPGEVVTAAPFLE
jgi:hypothetical protein